MPGGGPQGTLLGLFLFLVLINDCCQLDRNLVVGSMITNPPKKFCPATFCAKYIDDLSIAEALKIKETINNQTCKLYSELENIKAYSEENKMVLNLKKTKFCLSNPIRNQSFTPEVYIDNTAIVNHETITIWGVTVSNNLSWKSNTESIVSKAYKKLWAIRRLKKHGANDDDLLDVYTKQVRSVVEFGVPVWNSGLTLEEVNNIERIQKTFLHILLGNKYTNYNSALLSSGLERLSVRRTNLCKKFAQKTQRSDKYSHWFKANHKQSITRRVGSKYILPRYKHERFRKSPIFYLTSLLNSS